MTNEQIEELKRTSPTADSIIRIIFELTRRAEQGDEQLREALQKPNKNPVRMYGYITHEVEKALKERAGTQVVCMPDEWVFGLAIHYYTEDSPEVDEYDKPEEEPETDEYDTPDTGVKPSAHRASAGKSPKAGAMPGKGDDEQLTLFDFVEE